MNIILSFSYRFRAFRNPLTLDELIYLPQLTNSGKPSNKFNFKQIIHFNHEKGDSSSPSLFLLLRDAFGGKLKLFVCGIEEGGASEIGVIQIPKE